MTAKKEPWRPASVSGGCACGDWRFHVAEPPLWAGLCHCESCRRAVGGGVVAFFGVHTSALRWTIAPGAPEAVVVSRTPGVERRYCARCCAPLSYQSTRWPTEVHLFAGALDRPETFRPDFEVHGAEALPWIAPLAGVMRYPGSYDDADAERAADQVD